MAQVVVGVDPSGSVEGTGDECEIVVCGRGNDGTGYVIADETIRGTPGEWVNQIIHTYHHAYGVDALNQVGWRPSYVPSKATGRSE